MATTPIPEPLEPGTGPGPAPAPDALTSGDRWTTRPGWPAGPGRVPTGEGASCSAGWRIALVIGLRRLRRHSPRTLGAGAGLQGAQELPAQRFPVQAGDTVSSSSGRAPGPVVRSMTAPCVSSAGCRTSRRSRIRTPRPVTSPGRRDLVSHRSTSPTRGHAGRRLEEAARGRAGRRTARARRRARRPDDQSCRAGCDRLRGHRHRGRGDHPAADLRHRRRGRAADPGRRGRPGDQQRAHRPGGRRGRRAGLVDLARCDDGHRHRHRLHAAHDHPLQGVAGGGP